MRKRIAELYQHPFVRGGSIMLFGTAGIHVANYLYHLVMGRMLGPKDYGVLASLIGVLYLLNVINQTMHLVIVKFVSGFYGENNIDKVKALYHKLEKVVIVGSIAMVIILLFATPIINKFLHFEHPRFLFEISIAFAFFLIANFYRSFLQGLIRFGQFAINLTLEMAVKLIFAVILVAMGFGIDGAAIPLGIGSLGSILLGLWMLKDIRGGRHKIKEVHIDKRALAVFTLPSIALTLSFASLFTTDIILVRHYFPGIESGLYASLAVLGKIIFYASVPLVLTMYPLVSKAKSEKGKHTYLLFLTLAPVLGISLILAILYFSFPNVIIRLLFGSAYQETSNLLGLMGIFLNFYSFSFAISNYFLSLGKSYTTLFPLLAALAQIIGIILFHTSLTQVIYVSIVTTGILALAFLVYYIVYEKTK